MHIKVEGKRPSPRSSFSFTPVYSRTALKNTANDIFNINFVSDEVFTRRNCGFYLFGGETKQGASNELWIL